MERHSYTRLTLALDIIGRISDGPWNGYHELAAIKHQIDLHDTIAIEPSSRLSLECNDHQVPCDERNVCLQAVTLLQKEYNIDRSVRITLHKRIPVMGGLAGGSANAATTLQILNDLWKLRLSVHRLKELGRMLGMDVPFYFIGGTAFDSEAAGYCEPLPTKVVLTFVLVLPDFGVSTAEAYRGIDYRTIGHDRPLTERMKHYCLANSRQGVVSSIHNDFERSVFLRHPRLREIKEKLLKAGCAAAALSGSGSTVFGVASDKEEAEVIQKKMKCRTIIASTLMRQAGSTSGKGFTHGQSE
ncbi:MAG: 4-(cytidine 5'-diphospho)-2-C-methyl-D-erythritol kinase [Chitinispirillaceae bacterium]|nr:4-(cytidine 5'-diphospho)-2-C-methyl-D-erythritol kinase [Chitinispirillaceae bacterium]